MLLLKVGHPSEGNIFLAVLLRSCPIISWNVILALLTSRVCTANRSHTISAFACAMLLCAISGMSYTDTVSRALARWFAYLIKSNIAFSQLRGGIYPTKRRNFSPNFLQCMCSDWINIQCHILLFPFHFFPLQLNLFFNLNLCGEEQLKITVTRETRSSALMITGI